jgi:CheY-like chemotaxis protein
MSPNLERPTTSVLLIDGNDTERRFYANGLKNCSPDNLILEAADGQSGLNLYRRSQWIDCVVLELALPDRSGLEVLADLLPIPSSPQVAVIILTKIAHRELLELAKQNGACACFEKQHTSVNDLAKAILRAVALVGLMPKEGRHRAV